MTDGDASTETLCSSSIIENAPTLISLIDEGIVTAVRPDSLNACSSIFLILFDILTDFKETQFSNNDSDIIVTPSGMAIDVKLMHSSDMEQALSIFSSTAETLADVHELGDEQNHTVRRLTLHSGALASSPMPWVHAVPAGFFA